MIEKKNAFEEGRNAFKAGISDKSNPYNINDSTHLFWLQGWRHERRVNVKKFRKEHREDIIRSYQHLKERYEADWIRYTRASNGNIFTQGLNNLKARKIIKNIGMTKDVKDSNINDTAGLMRKLSILTSSVARAIKSPIFCLS